MKKIVFVLVILHVGCPLESQWIQILANQYALYNCIQFINQNTGWHTGGLSVAKSTNGGDTWTTQISFSENVFPRWLYFYDENYGWVVCQDGIILRTTNGGDNWSMVVFDEPTYFNSVFFVNVNTGWVAGGNSVTKIAKTTNGGINWFSQYSSSWDWDYHSITFINNTTGWASGGYGRIRKTTDGGQNWFLQPTGTTEDLDQVFFVSEKIGWAGGGVLLKTTNGGSNWIPLNTGIPFFGIGGMYFIDSLKGWIVGGGYWIALTTNGGVNWSQQHLESYGALYSVNFINDSVGWASGFEKIFKTTNGGRLVGLVEKTYVVPSSFSLFQNYPNPFNPDTKIKFDIPASHSFGDGSRVRLCIYDILGREVETIVNEELRPGSYEAEWDGSNFASGIYFYSLQTEQFSETRKMVLMK